MPGGRTAVNLTMGAVRNPLRSFIRFDQMGTASWAVYWRHRYQISRAFFSPTVSASSQEP